MRRVAVCCSKLAWISEDEMGGGVWGREGVAGRGGGPK